MNIVHNKNSQIMRPLARGRHTDQIFNRNGTHSCTHKQIRTIFFYGHLTCVSEIRCMQNAQKHSLNGEPCYLDMVCIGPAGRYSFNVVYNIYAFYMRSHT